MFRVATSGTLSGSIISPMSADTTRQLTRGIAAGDPVAIEAYYREYFGLMLHEARRSTGTGESGGLDLVHDAMLKALHSMKPIGSREELDRWTRRLVRSVAIDALRQSARRVRREIRTASSETESDRQEEHELLQARILWLRERMRELDDSSSRLITMRYDWGWSLKQIATALGLRTGAVDGRLRRLVCQLRESARILDDE